MVEQRRLKREQQKSLIKFVQGGWRYIDPAPYKGGWHLQAIADHLEAVTRGEIRRLVINVPPRTSKSSMVSVAWPAWTWAQEGEEPLAGPHVQFLFASYAQSLSLRDGVKTRRLIESPWYQRNWGTRFELTGDQNTKIRFENDQGGYRLATSVGGALTGEGAAIIVCDDPHNAVEMESEAVRKSTLEWWDESLSTRLNDPKTGAYVVIMQRLHEEDLTGHILSRQEGDWTHLCLPMRYDASMPHVPTAIGFVDPRTEDGELLCEDRFGEAEVRDLETRLGPFASAGQLQQSPTQRGGAIIKRDYWQLWEEEKYPALDFVLASADTAYTEKEENDPTGFTIWGVFRDKQDRPRALLLWAWAKHCELLAKPLERLPGETKKAFDIRSMPTWGVVEWIAYSCRRFRVDQLLIENKASGKSVAQAIQRLYAEDAWNVRLVDPARDKVARAWTVEPLFAAGLVYAPDEENAPWVEKVLQQCEVFPRGKHDDLVDSVSMGLKFLKDTGLIAHNFEVSAELREAMQHQPVQKPLYEA